MNNEYSDIIDSLQTLQAVTVDAVFRKHMKQTIFPNRILSKTLLPFTVIRMAFIFLAILFIGSGTIIIASATSNSRGLLYPVKEAVTAITDHFNSNPIQKKLNNKLVISPTAKLAATTTPSPENAQVKADSTHQMENIAIVTPTIQPVVTTNSTPMTQPTHTTAPVSAHIQISGTPVNVNLSNGSNPPSGNGDNTGTDPKPSLLPKVNVNTPVVNLGL
jgi:hypothetical protein